MFFTRARSPFTEERNLNVIFQVLLAMLLGHLGNVGKLHRAARAFTVVMLRDGQVRSRQKLDDATPAEVI
ncbi:unnamed protein product [Soboliphyme baturini]|uniref:Transposase n=1 Tax=Soboliphyme baturini TaxID=241478 RepID=A0A183IZC6_9BILA|nr:unnamed protein product [Soboliphyme baturini]